MEIFNNQLLQDEHYALLDFLKGFCSQNLNAWENAKESYLLVFKRLSKKKERPEIFLFAIMQLLNMAACKKIKLTTHEQSDVISFIPEEYLEHLYLAFFKKISKALNFLHNESQFEMQMKYCKSSILLEERGFLIRYFMKGLGAQAEILLIFLQGAILFYYHTKKTELEFEVKEHFENFFNFKIEDENKKIDEIALSFSCLKFGACGERLLDLKNNYPSSLKEFDIEFIEKFILFCFLKYKNEISKLLKTNPILKGPYEYFTQLENLYFKPMNIGNAGPEEKHESSMGNLNTPLRNIIRVIHRETAKERRSGIPSFLR